MQSIILLQHANFVLATFNALPTEVEDKAVWIKNGEIERIVIDENPKKCTDLEWWDYACKKDDKGHIES